MIITILMPSPTQSTPSQVQKTEEKKKRNKHDIK